jgi:hypothetical protein
MTKIERVELIKNRLGVLKKTPFIQKAGAAELLIEDAVYLLSDLVGEIDGLELKHKALMATLERRKDGQ